MHSRETRTMDFMIKTTNTTGLFDQQKIDESNRKSKIITKNSPAFRYMHGSEFANFRKTI